MRLPALNAETPAHQNNMRLVVVDERHQPTHLARSQVLEKALARAAEKLGVLPEDMPGLYGVCMEAVRSAEIHHR